MRVQRALFWTRMRSLQGLVVVALVPSLIARTESVSELLHSPKIGEAKLTLSDGTLREGSIIRVTNQFVTISSHAAIL